MSLKVKGDLHLHSSTKYCGECSVTELTDLQGLCGCLPFNRVVEIARDGFRMEYLAISNHAFDPAVLKPDYRDARERILKEATEIKEINKNSDLGIQLLTGVETNILPGGRLDVDNETLSELEVVVAARHLFPKNQTAKDIKADFLKALENPSVNILGHPNRWIEGLSLNDWEEVFAAAAKNKIAIEINARTPLSDELLDRAQKHQAVFSLGSDAHEFSPKHSKDRLNLKKLYRTMNELLEHLARLGIEEAQILNSHHLGELKRRL